jgi:Ca2+-binding RTX toxin-like protein
MCRTPLTSSLFLLLDSFFWWPTLDFRTHALRVCHVRAEVGGDPGGEQQRRAHRRRGDDTMFGGAGDDVLIGGPGNNTIDGGPETTSSSTA